MTIVHLTDEQLQHFAEAPDSLGTRETLHISECESCRLRAQNYRMLRASLNEMEKPAFDFDLATLVVEQLPASGSRYQRAAFLVACAGTVLMVLMVLIYSPELVVLFNRLPQIVLYMTAIPALAIFLLQCFCYLKEYKRRVSLIT